MKRPWYADGLQFECVRCGACCTGEPGYVWVTEGELFPLAAAKGMTAEEFRERYLRQVGSSFTVRERANGDCAMLKGNGCSVYDARPAQCRTFPFWPEFLDSRASWDEAARGCPGMNHGRLCSLEEIERILRCSAPT